MAKTCNKCGKTYKSEDVDDSFHKGKLSRDGYQAYCKECCVDYGKSRSRINKEKVKMAIKVLEAFEREEPEIYKRIIQKINKLGDKE